MKPLTIARLLAIGSTFAVLTSSLAAADESVVQNDTAHFVTTTAAPLAVDPNANTDADHHDHAHRHHHHHDFLGGGHHDCIHDTPAMRRALYGRFSAPSTASSDNGDDGTDSATNAGNNFTVVEIGRRKAFHGMSSNSNDADGSSSASYADLPHGPEELLTTALINVNYGGSSRRGAGSGRRDTTLDRTIRIVFRTPDLDDSSKYCPSATVTRGDMNTGAQIQCTTETILTAAKRTFLTNTVLPRAAQALENILKVTPVVGNMLIPNNICGSYFTIPASDTAPGVSNADFVIYVAAAPTSGSTVAWAGYCALDQAGRPVVAISNFSPKYLDPNQSDADLESVVRTGVHELLHALGFSNSYMQSKYFAASGVITTGQKRRGGQPVTLYTGAGAVNGLRRAFACWTATGVELEDEGGSGTAGSHWERRFHREDLMAGIISDSMTYSEMTFGVLEDSGHYSIDRTQLETERLMHYAGCDVFDNKCSTPAGGAGVHYCFDTSSTSACTWDYKSIGVCATGTYTADLPSWGQYFAGSPRIGSADSLMNYCPTISAYSNRHCSRADNSDAANTNIGLYYGSDGRCFKTTATLYKNGLADNGPARCFKSRCPNGNRVEFQVGDSNVWMSCPSDGSAGVMNAPSPYTGQIYCPVASEFCTSDLLFGVAAPTTTIAEGATVVARTEVTKVTTTTASPQNTGGGGGFFSSLKKLFGGDASSREVSYAVVGIAIVGQLAVSVLY